jgi:hypothetical protein
MNDPDFIQGFADNFAEMRRLVAQNVTIQLRASGAQPAYQQTVSALVDMETGEVAVVKGGLEEQRMVVVTVARTDMQAATTANTSKQMLITIPSGEILLVNDISRTPVRPL